MKKRGISGYTLPEKREATKERLKSEGNWVPFVRRRTHLVEIEGWDRGVAQYACLYEFPPGGVVPDDWVTVEEFKRAKEEGAKAKRAKAQAKAAEPAVENPFATDEAKPEKGKSAEKISDGGDDESDPFVPVAESAVEPVKRIVKEDGSYELPKRFERRGILAGMSHSVVGGVPPADGKHKSIGVPVEEIDELSDKVHDAVVRNGDEMIRSIFWIYDNIGTKNVKMSDAPNPGDYSYLISLKNNPALLASFYKDVYAKVLPNQSSLNERRKYESGVKTVDSLLHRLEAVVVKAGDDNE